MPHAPKTFRPSWLPQYASKEYKPKSRSIAGASWQYLYKTARWQKARLVQLATEPLCRICAEEGRVTGATIVDHIIAHRGDVELFFDTSNWQSVCKPCHDSHLQRRDKGFAPKPVIGADGYVASERPSYLREDGLGDVSHPPWFVPLKVPLFIVCGPPASGKSTYVAARRHSTDLVLDLDVMAHDMFGMGAAMLSGAQRMRCLRQRNNMLRDLMVETPATISKVWLIVSEPAAAKRQWWADTLKPEEIIVLEETTSTCIERARADAKQRRAHDVAASITEWWQIYRPRAGDRVIRS